MNANIWRAVIGAAVIVVAVVLLIVLRAGGEETKSDAGEVPTVVVGKDGKPVGGIVDLAYNRGDEIHFKVHSALADEIHVHGYDLMKDVEAGGTVSFDFPASIEGVFEAELEGRKQQIVELRVNP